MGFAIQRGGTCMVAALDELLTLGRWGRGLALLEAALWVGGGLVLLGAAGWAMPTPPQYASGLAPLAGGALLGLGAWVNRGCALGTIARLGSGELSYAAMPAGFLLGAWSASIILTATAAPSAPMQGAWLGTILAAGFGVVAVVRLSGSLRAARQRRFLAHLWTPQRATIVIALAFLALMLVAGAWSYTQWLVDLAHGRSPMTGSRLLLFGGLFAGALLGGRTAGAGLVRPGGAALGRSLVGGFVMGVGGQIVPGGNDGLILIGLPFLERPAILALAVMAATIAGAILLARTLPRLGRSRRSG